MTSEIDTVITVLVDHFRFSQSEPGFQHLLQAVEKDPNLPIVLEAEVSKFLGEYYVVSTGEGTAILPCSQALKDYEPGETIRGQLIKIDRWHFGDILDKDVRWRRDDDGTPLAPLISEKKLHEFERSLKKEELLGSIKVGQTVTGIVKTVVDYGISVDIGGVNGLVMGGQSQYSVGDKVEVSVTNFDQERGRVSLKLADSAL